MIEINGINKNFGTKHVLKDVTFNVAEGEIMGFLGPNGAGKTTTLNILTGYLSATSGTAKIDGTDILEKPLEAKSKIGFLPEQPPLYTDMTVKEYLSFVYSLKNCRIPRAQHIKEICDVVRIGDVYNRIIKNLSKGYRQRVGLAQALLGDPEVLILDEPMVGLDPKQIIEIRELIRSLGKKHTVILSSHILSEITSICDHVMIISHGKLAASDTPENLSHYMKNSDVCELKIRGSREACDQARELLKRVKGLEITASAASLEDVFLELTSSEPEKDEEAKTEEERPEERKPEPEKAKEGKEGKENAGDL